MTDWVLRVYIIASIFMTMWQGQETSQLVMYFIILDALGHIYSVTCNEVRVAWEKYTGKFSTKYYIYTVPSLLLFYCKASVFLYLVWR